MGTAGKNGWRSGQLHEDRWGHRNPGRMFGRLQTEDWSAYRRGMVIGHYRELAANAKLLRYCATRFWAVFGCYRAGEVGVVVRSPEDGRRTRDAVSRGFR